MNVGNGDEKWTVIEVEYEAIEMDECNIPQYWWNSQLCRRNIGPERVIPLTVRHR